MAPLPKHYWLSPDAALNSCSDMVSLAAITDWVDRWAYFSVTALLLVAHSAALRVGNMTGALLVVIGRSKAGDTT